MILRRRYHSFRRLVYNRFGRLGSFGGTTSQAKREALKVPWRRSRLESGLQSPGYIRGGCVADQWRDWSRDAQWYSCYVRRAALLQKLIGHSSKTDVDMTDVFSRSKRSWVMSRIRGVHTAPERLVRRFLHERGFRFRLHVRSLPGCPDIVLPRHKSVVFVHGCFWHHHALCKNAVYPRTRAGFWRTKIDGNVVRYKQNLRKLRKLGWRVFTVWECEIGKGSVLETRLGPLLGRDK